MVEPGCRKPGRGLYASHWVIEGCQCLPIENRKFRWGPYSRAEGKENVIALGALSVEEMRTLSRKQLRLNDSMTLLQDIRAHVDAMALR